MSDVLKWHVQMSLLFTGAGDQLLGYKYISNVSTTYVSFAVSAWLTKTALSSSSFSLSSLYGRASYSTLK